MWVKHKQKVILPAAKGWWHQSGPTVKKRLQVCRGIHRCVWYFISSVPLWIEGFHKLHQVRAVIFWFYLCRSLWRAQIHVLVLSLFLCHNTSLAAMYVTQDNRGSFTGEVLLSDSTFHLLWLLGLGWAPLHTRRKKTKKLVWQQQLNRSGCSMKS